MKNIIDNKKTIIICVFTILFVILISYLNNRKSNDDNILMNEKQIQKYEANQIIPVNITDEDMAKKYLNDFKNLILSDIAEAYNTLNEDYRIQKFNDISEFQNYINDQLSVSFYSLSVEKYKVRMINGKKYFDIYASDDNRYIIKENSIMNYEVFLDEYTIEIK